jgi:hypothetical protein
MIDRDPDDDTPDIRDDNAAHPMDHAAAAARLVGAEFYRAFKNANSGDPTQEARGLIEMQVVTIRDGEWPGRGGYQRLPAHVPDDEAGMRRLSVSKVSADADMKADLYAWAHANREHRDRAAKAIEVAVGSWRRADVVLADENCTDEQLSDWCTAIVNHIMQEWKINIRVAPEDNEALLAWCAEAAGRFDVTPRWLTGEEKNTMFEPTAHRVKATNPMRPFKANIPDE